MPPTGDTEVAVGYKVSDVSKIASEASVLRIELGLRPEDAVPILDVLEFGIAEKLQNFRFVVDLDANFDHAVLAAARSTPPVIIVRESVYKHAAAGSEAARVVLAHELGHLWLRHGDVATTDSQLEHHTLEWQADEFAAELLMPSNVAGSMTHDRIAKQYEVPTRTAAVRLRTLKARGKNLVELGVPRFEPYAGLLSPYEKEVLKWVPQGGRGRKKIDPRSSSRARLSA